MADKPSDQTDLTAFLAELEALRASRPPGDWTCAPWNTQPNSYVYGPAPLHDGEARLGLLKTYPPISMTGEDARLVCAAVNALPKLIATIRSLREEDAALRSALAGIAALDNVRDSNQPPIPTALKRWKLCVELAREALKGP